MACILIINVGSPGCLPGQFLCGDGKCVDRSAICNGYYDCIDAADERDCSELQLHLKSHLITKTLTSQFEPAHAANINNFHSVHSVKCALTQFLTLQICFPLHI